MVSCCSPSLHIRHRSGDRKGGPGVWSEVGGGVVVWVGFEWVCGCGGCRGVT
jgi:hypothetical protein